MNCDELSCYKSRDYINSHIISFIIFGNAIQFIISGMFHVDINIAIIEYILLIMSVFVNNAKLNSLINLLLIFGTITIFLLNMVFVPNLSVNAYFKEFIIYVIPLLIIFSFSLKYKLLTKTMFYYAMIGTMFSMILIITKNEVIYDYMTFGYHIILFVSFIILYSFYNKKRKIFIISIFIIPVVLIYTSRAAWLVLLCIGITVVILEIKSRKQKLVLLIIGTAIVSNGINILKWFINYILAELNINSYASKNILVMLNSVSLEDNLGDRYYLYKNSIEAINSHLLFGMGIGKFQDVYNIYPHNIILDIYVTFGIIVGTGIIVALVILGIKSFALTKNSGIEIKVILVFISCNMIKLLFSKTFIYEQSFWLYIVFCLNLLNNRRRT